MLHSAERDADVMRARAEQEPTTFTLIVPATHAAPNEMLPLSADMNNMHLMDPESGRVV